MSDHFSEDSLVSVLFELSSEAQLIFNEQGILQCNQAAVDMLRMSGKAEIFGHHPADFSPEFQPDGRRSREKREEMVQLAYDNGFHRFEWLHLRSDGELFECEVCLTPVQIPTGPALLTLWNDVSRRKQDEAQLQRIESRLELALSGGDVGLWDWDMDTDEVFFSDQWHRQLGLSPKTLSHYSDWECRVHPDDLPDAVDRVRDTVASGRSEYESTFRMKHASGEYIWILARGMLFLYPDGTPKRLLGVHLDITVQKRNERRLSRNLHRSEVMLQTLESTIRTESIENLCKIVCVQQRHLIGCHIGGVDLKPLWRDQKPVHQRSYSRKYVQCEPLQSASDDISNSKLFQSIRVSLSMTQQEMETHPSTVLFCKATADRPPLRGILACPLTDGSGEQIGTIWLSDKDSGEFQASDRSLLRQLAYIVSVLVVRLRAEEELRRNSELLDASNQELQQFAYIASHDLQQPLRAIANYAAFLLEDYGARLEDEGREFLQKQIAAAQRMKKLIDDLLQYSRVNSDERQPTNVDFNDVIQEAIGRLELAIKESSASVRYDGLPIVLGIESRLTQLMQNLIGNAIKYRGCTTPSITITAESQQNHWLFTVQDNGIGIDPKHHQEAFQVFRRLQAGSHVEGTGIGLALCKRIVQRHGGQIWIEESSQQGTRVCFQIAKAVV